MGLYAQGKSGAMATIRAAINARVRTGTDGVPTLDRDSLRAWLAAQANEIIATDVLAANRAAAQGVKESSSSNTTPDVDALMQAFSPERWKNTPGVPTLSTVTSSPNFVTATMAAIAEMWRVAQDIKLEYERIVRDLPAIFNTAYDDLKIEGNLPKTEERFVESRFYVCTYVTDRGEESAPSPVSDLIEVDQKDTVGIAIPPAPPGRHIVKWRLYRSRTGSQATGFDGVDEGLVTALTYTDARKGSELLEPCPTTIWAEPPKKLRGLVSLPNGILAGFFGNTVCFCEPYYPYAWPVEYQLTTQWPITALGVFGQTLVVMHEAGVDYISGADSSSMAQQKDVSKQACVAARSVVGVEGSAVLFASPDGLYAASSGGVRSLTEGLFTREDWQKIQPKSIIAAYHEGSYFALHDSSTGQKAMALHLELGRLTTLDAGGSTLYVDALTDRLYIAQGSNIVALFAGTEYRTGVWRSKIAVLPQQAGFSWLAVESDFSAPVMVKWFGDGVLRHTAVVNSRAPQRMPAGRYLEHEIEVSSQARWNSVTVASSGDELRGI